MPSGRPSPQRPFLHDPRSQPFIVRLVCINTYQDASTSMISHLDNPLSFGRRVRFRQLRGSFGRTTRTSFSASPISDRHVLHTHSAYHSSTPALLHVCTSSARLLQKRGAHQYYTDGHAGSRGRDCVRLISCVIIISCLLATHHQPISFGRNSLRDQTASASPNLITHSRPSPGRQASLDMPASA